jgi:hypothetical protein
MPDATGYLASRAIKSTEEPAKSRDWAIPSAVSRARGERVWLRGPTGEAQIGRRSRRCHHARYTQRRSQDRRRLRAEHSPGPRARYPFPGVSVAFPPEHDGRKRLRQRAETAFFEKARSIRMWTPPSWPRGRALPASPESESTDLARPTQCSDDAECERRPQGRPVPDDVEDTRSTRRPDSP